MKNKELWIFVVLLALAAAAMFLMLRPRRAAARAQPPARVVIEDRRTIDFSSGRPVVKDDAAERALIAQGEKEMAEAAQGVTFAPRKKE